MKSSSSKRRQSDVTAEESPGKRQKTGSSSCGENRSPPKSKKQLRQELKAALKAKAVANAVNGRVNVNESEAVGEQRRRSREEKRQERKARKEEKERALEARYHEQDRLKLVRQNEQVQLSTEGQQRGDRPDKTSSRKRTNGELERHAKKETKKPKKCEEQKKQADNFDLVVYKSLFKKSTDPITGATTCRMGVQYVDVKVGTGPVVQRKSLVTVKYQLRGGSPNGRLLDSSNRFKFRLGKGEVIQGWEIGLEGMKQGGVRHLIVPPKAGYGSQDIGAGSGAMLYFVVTMLEV